MLLLLCLPFGCKQQEETAVAPQHIHNIYTFMKGYALMDSTTRQQAYLADSTTINAFMRTVSEMPVNDGLLEAWSGSNVVGVFTPAVDSVYRNLENVELQLGSILEASKAEGLELPQREYAAVVYGRPESILFVDSTMLIAMNHYLGEDYPGYSHWPAFMRQTKTPEMLPYDIAEALIATQYPYTQSESSTLLSRMIYEGALAHAKAAVVPDSNLKLVLGYDDETLDWLKDNEAEIWHSLIANHLLYDTSESVASRMIEPAPQVSLVAPVAPGRVGRYIGYRIVADYLKKHADTPLPSMLSPVFYGDSKVLIESGYGR